MRPKTESEPPQMPLHGQNTKQRHFLYLCFCLFNEHHRRTAGTAGGFSNSSGSTGQSVFKC